MYTIIVSVVNSAALVACADVLIQASADGQSPASHLIYHGEMDAAHLAILSMCDIRDGDLDRGLTAVGLQRIGE
jgi:hypothetical protein